MRREHDRVGRLRSDRTQDQCLAQGGDERSFDGFLAGIAMELPNDLDPEDAARVGEGEIADITNMLPSAIRTLWPPAAHERRAS